MDSKTYINNILNLFEDDSDIFSVILSNTLYRLLYVLNSTKDVKEIFKCCNVIEDLEDIRHFNVYGGEDTIFEILREKGLSWSDIECISTMVKDENNLIKRV